MTRKEARLKRFAVGAAAMSENEREAMREALYAAGLLSSSRESSRMIAAVEGIGAARGRALQRQESDRRTDASRRKLVGARLPVEDWARCRRCAEHLGISSYRFVVTALEEACNRADGA